ncbi:hypothetical protein T07_13905 [Trichinella nelsoni]|uniref:Apple domain-containing protein n=1 Tax=Trichinella nelsoni TaxID=6336 RepID=A0A0V0RYQ4_9BILA|nr:hypothetical protein T07_13905 [Trichinella nelsoni]
MLQQLYRISFGFTKTLLFIYYLFSTSESSPMYSFVYIPLLDKVCLIEKYIPQEYPIASRIPIFMYDSFESCIAACSTYSTRELLCNAFMYSDITKACHLHFYALHLTAGMCPVETGQSQFYLHHGCFTRNNTLLNASVNEKNETDDKIIFLPDLHKSCLIRKRFISESFYAKVTAYMTEKSLKKCLSRCVVKGAEACNSVIFSLQEKSCTLVTHQSTFSVLSETVQSSAYFFEIDHCKTKVVKNPLLLQILSPNPTIPIQSISGYSVQHIPITESENATVIDLLDCTTIQCCLQCCILKRVALGCNAIFFNAKEKTCLLMKLNVNSSKVAEFVLYNLYTDNDKKEKLILSNYEDTLRFKTSFVSLHEFHERCQITTFTSAYAENLKVHPLILQANTLNDCLNLCRSNRSDIFNCSGVLFSKHEEICYQLVEGTSHDQIVTLNGQAIVLLQHCVKDAVSKQHIFFTVIFITNLGLANCNWMSVYVPKLDATCALVAKKLNDFEAYYIEQEFCSFESCIAICFQHRYPCNSIKYTPFAKKCELYIRNATYDSLPEDVETGQSRHLLLHSCHKDISAVPVGKIIHTTLVNTDGIIADLHLPSIHRVCRVQKRPFVESYRTQHLLLITASSLKRCLAACDAPSHTSCNSVLFSIQEKTCILLKRRPGSFHLQGSSPTFETDAQYFIILLTYDDFTRPEFYAIPSSRRQPVIAYAAANLDMQIAIHHEIFYASKAAIRLQLWDSADEKECLKICIASITTDYCDAYYFSSRENTCLTMRSKKQSASAVRHGHRSITKFYDDETLNITLRDPNEASLKYPDHFTEMEVSLHEFKEICVTQHWISTLIPNTVFSKHYENISFFNECINICRHLKNTEECKGIAYSKQMKTCMIAVDGNENGEILLSNDQQYVTLSSCIKAQGFMYSFEEEVEENVNRISAVKLKATAEICIVERHPFSESFLLKRTGMLFLQSLELCLAHCRVLSVRGKCHAVLFSGEERVCLLLRQNQPLKSRDVMRKSTSQFFTLNYCDYNMTESSERRYYNSSGKIINLRVESMRVQCTLHEIPLLRKHMKHQCLLWKSMNFKNCIKFCARQFRANLCNAVYFEAEEKTCLHMLLNASEALYEYSESKRETVHFIEKCVKVAERQEYQQESAINRIQSDETSISSPSRPRNSRTHNARDRPDERKRNGEPLIYYFEETQQICATEIYKQKNLTSWEVVAINKDISNFQVCLLNCIVNNQCNAINYFQTKECYLIKSAEENYIFVVKDDSIFAEVLYCESGTLVDIIRQK